MVSENALARGSVSEAKLLAMIGLNLISGFTIAWFFIPTTKGEDGNVTYPFKSRMTPNDGIFMAIWTFFYCCTPLVYQDAYNATRSPQRQKQFSMAWAAQFLLQNAWPILFFGLKLYHVAFTCLIFLLFTAAINRQYIFSAGVSLNKGVWILYLAWLCFACMLNYTSSVDAFNRGHTQFFSPVDSLCTQDNHFGTLLGRYAGCAGYFRTHGDDICGSADHPFLYNIASLICNWQQPQFYGSDAK